MNRRFLELSLWRSMFCLKEHFQNEEDFRKKNYYYFTVNLKVRRMHITLNGMCTKLCKYTASGCLGKGTEI